MILHSECKSLQNAARRQKSERASRKKFFTKVVATKNFFTKLVVILQIRMKTWNHKIRNSREKKIFYEIGGDIRNPYGNMESWHTDFTRGAGYPLLS
jgi:hypothetical protein